MAEKVTRSEVLSWPKESLPRAWVLDDEGNADHVLAWAWINGEQELVEGERCFAMRDGCAQVEVVAESCSCSDPSTCDCEVTS